MHGIIATWRMAKEGIEQGFEQLNQNGKASDAIETAIKAVEDFPYYKSVGYGGLPNEDQVVEFYFLCSFFYVANFITCVIFIYMF